MPHDPPPRRRFGQNFLVDRRAIARILDALEPLEDGAVVEIGPGRGALTRPLLERTGGALTAIEVDRDLAHRLQTEFGSAGLRLHVGDVLDLEWTELLPRGAGAPRQLLLVGNLPYNVSKPIASKVIEGHPHIARAVLMFQREVAQRLLAHPGSKEYGPLTVLAGLHYRIERVLELGPESFRPRPKVRSTVTRWSPRADAPSPSRAVRVRRCLRDCFAARRRTLRNNARRALGLDDLSLERLFGSAGVDPDLRAEAVSPEGFVRLADVWTPRGD